MVCSGMDGNSCTVRETKIGSEISRFYIHFTGDISTMLRAHSTELNEIIASWYLLFGDPSISSTCTELFNINFLRQHVSFPRPPSSCFSYGMCATRSVFTYYLTTWQLHRGFALLSAFLRFGRVAGCLQLVLSCMTPSKTSLCSTAWWSSSQAGLCFLYRGKKANHGLGINN